MHTAMGGIMDGSLEEACKRRVEGSEERSYKLNGRREGSTEERESKTNNERLKRKTFNIIQPKE